MKGTMIQSKTFGVLTIGRNQGRHRYPQYCQEQTWIGSHFRLDVQRIVSSRRMLLNAIGEIKCFEMLMLVVYIIVFILYNAHDLYNHSVLYRWL